MARTTSCFLHNEIKPCHSAVLFAKTMVFEGHNTYLSSFFFAWTTLAILAMPLRIAVGARRAVVLHSSVRNQVLLCPRGLPF